MDALIRFAEGFSNVVTTMGAVFAGITTGIVPKLMVLMTIFFFISKAIGEERVEKAVRGLFRWGVLRYSVAPFISALLLAVPMDFVPGKWLEDRHKASFFDACLALHHPMLGFFPHVHAPEYFVYFGLAQGLEQLGLSLGPYNVRILLAAFVLAVVRGYATQWTYTIIERRGAGQAMEAA